MGYIKKLKNNELVGGTDKHTIYPVTSTKAVFEEVGENNFKTQETINGEHDDRIKGLEEEMPETVKSITINGGTEHTVDESGNVDLTIYTVNPDDPDVPAMADLVEKNRDDIADIKEEIGTDTTENSLSGRIKSLETTVGTGGSVDQRISDAVTIEKNRAESIEGGLQTKLSVGAGITLTSDGVISATADPSVGKVVETLPTGDEIIEGIIYLVQKANTPGTYVQWVHYGNDWTNKGEISLGITTDDTLDSTSSNPIQNAAIAAQIGYFVCGSGYASSEIKDVDALGFKLPDVGGDFKIKMNAANTHAGPVYLRFNSSNDTKAELKYNREPVTPDNSWEENEVISVYYDGTNYQASNAQGGSNKKIDAYLYGDLRTLAVGQTYEENEAVKTQDKQLMRVTKEVRLMNLTDEVTIDDLKAYGTTATYKALIAITAFDESRDDYADGDYAIKDGVVSKYDGSEWSAVTLADYAADTTVWEEVNIIWIIENITKQDTTQLAIDTELYAYEPLNLDTYGKKNTRAINIENGKWDNVSGAQAWIYLFPVEKGQVYKITAKEVRGTQYTFLHSYNVAKNTLADYATGYDNTIRISAGDSVTVKAPDDAAYLYVLWATGGTSYAPESVGLRYSRLSKSESDVKELQSIPITSVEYGSSPQGVVNGYTWDNTSNYYGYWFNLTEYAGHYLRFKVKPNRYMFTTAKPSSSASSSVLPILLGKGVVKQNGDDVIIPSPTTEGGDVWFWIYTYSKDSTPKTFYDISDISILHRGDDAVDVLRDNIKENTLYSFDRITKLARYVNDNTNAIGFFHFSDLHGDETAYLELKNFIAKHSDLFNDIIETGDKVYQNNTQWKPLVSPNALFVLGNHDCSTNNSGDNFSVSKQSCYETFFEPYIESNGVEMGDAENYSMYWKKDYDNGKMKIRVIGLDGIHILGRNGNTTDDSQEQWFAETLADAKTNGYKVIVACHYMLEPFDGDYAKWDEESHKWKYNYIAETEGNTGGRVMNEVTGRPVSFHSLNWMKWINEGSFNMRTTAEVTFNGVTYPSGSNIFGEILSDWINNDNGEFIAWLCGHTHVNFMFYPTKYPNILNIVATSAGTRRAGSPNLNSRDNGVNVNMSGHLYYINQVTIKTKNTDTDGGNPWPVHTTLTVIRVGNNMSSKTLVPCSWMTIDLNTGQVISEG